MAEDPNYASFQNICKDLNQTTICSFKNNIHIRGIVETVDINFGNDYLNNILKFKESQYIDWSLIKKLNDIGGPYMNEFIINNNRYLLSPTTLRYVYYSLDMLSYIKSLNLSRVQVTEVGGGYGFQCILFFELAKLFSLDIYKYQIVDLPEANNMQKQYIMACESCIEPIMNKIEFCSFYDITNIKFESENSFFISNYALGEFTKDIQDFYMKNIVSIMIHGYICWNFSVGNPAIHSHILSLHPIIEEENPQTNCPPVKSYIIKF
jgi:hypothetical protein